MGVVEIFRRYNFNGIMKLEDGEYSFSIDKKYIGNKFLKFINEELKGNYELYLSTKLKKDDDSITIQPLVELKVMDGVYIRLRFNKHTFKGADYIHIPFLLKTTISDNISKYIPPLKIILKALQDIRERDTEVRGVIDITPDLLYKMDNGSYKSFYEVEAPELSIHINIRGTKISLDSGGRIDTLAVRGYPPFKLDSPVFSREYQRILTYFTKWYLGKLLRKYQNTFHILDIPIVIDKIRKNTEYLLDLLEGKKGNITAIKKISRILGSHDRILRFFSAKEESTTNAPLENIVFLKDGLYISVGGAETYRLEDILPLEEDVELPRMIIESIYRELLKLVLNKEMAHKIKGLTPHGRQVLFRIFKEEEINISHLFDEVDKGLYVFDLLSNDQIRDITRRYPRVDAYGDTREMLEKMNNKLFKIFMDIYSIPPLSPDKPINVFTSGMFIDFLTESTVAISRSEVYLRMFGIEGFELMYDNPFPFFSNGKYIILFGGLHGPKERYGLFLLGREDDKILIPIWITIGRDKVNTVLTTIFEKLRKDILIRTRIRHDYRLYPLCCDYMVPIQITPSSVRLVSVNLEEVGSLVNRNRVGD